MTDNEIIKALECLMQDNCEDCPYYRDDCTDRIKDPIELSKSTLDLINRQQAEIEKQKIILEQIEDTCNPLPFETDYDKSIKRAKADAIREYIKILEEMLSQNIDISNAGYQSIIYDMDKAYEEMVGEDDA